MKTKDQDLKTIKAAETFIKDYLVLLPVEYSKICRRESLKKIYKKYLDVVHEHLMDIHDFKFMIYKVYSRKCHVIAGDIVDGLVLKAEFEIFKALDDAVLAVEAARDKHFRKWKQIEDDIGHQPVNRNPFIMLNSNTINEE